jgi:4-hydroxy-2-oxoglutarate aldolase
VVSAANYLPARCAEVYRLFVSGQEELAWLKLNEVKALAAVTAGRFSVAGVKACMNIVGLSGGYPRLPVLPVAPSDLREMTESLQEAI